MKRNMNTCLLSLMLVFAASVASGETKCYTVEHPDFNEAVCTGDEKTIADKTELAPPRTTVSEAEQAQQPTPKVHAMPATERGTAKVPPVSSAPAAAAVQVPAPHASGTAKETAAEHLAKRKALAIQNKARMSAPAAATANP